MPTSFLKKRSIQGRIWEAQTRVKKLNAQRNELITQFELALLLGDDPIERAYDLSEASTRLDVQIKKAKADLELWRSLQ